MGYSSTGYFHIRQAPLHCDDHNYWFCGTGKRYVINQSTKKLMSDSPELVEFAVRLVDFILHLPDGK